MKGGTYAKTLTKIQVRGIFRLRDLRRIVFPKLIEICMETPYIPFFLAVLLKDLYHNGDAFLEDHMGVSSGTFK